MTYEEAEEFYNYCQNTFSCPITFGVSEGDIYYVKIWGASVVLAVTEVPSEPLLDSIRAIFKSVP